MILYLILIVAGLYLLFPKRKKKYQTIRGNPMIPPPGMKTLRRKFEDEKKIIYMPNSKFKQPFGSSLGSRNGIDTSVSTGFSNPTTPTTLDAGISTKMQEKSPSLVSLKNEKRVSFAVKEQQKSKKITPNNVTQLSPAAKEVEHAVPAKLNVRKEVPVSSEIKEYPKPNPESIPDVTLREITSKKRSLENEEKVAKKSKIDNKKRKFEDQIWITNTDKRMKVDQKSIVQARIKYFTDLGVREMVGRVVKRTPKKMVRKRPLRRFLDEDELDSITIKRLEEEARKKKQSELAKNITITNTPLKTEIGNHASDTPKETSTGFTFKADSSSNSAADKSDSFKAPLNFSFGDTPSKPAVEQINSSNSIKKAETNSITDKPDSIKIPGGLFGNISTPVKPAETTTPSFGATDGFKFGNVANDKKDSTEFKPPAGNIFENTPLQSIKPGNGLFGSQPDKPKNPSDSPVKKIDFGGVPAPAAALFGGIDGTKSITTTTSDVKSNGNISQHAEIGLFGASSTGNVLKPAEIGLFGSTGKEETSKPPTGSIIGGIDSKNETNKPALGNFTFGAAPAAPPQSKSENPPVNGIFGSSVSTFGNKPSDLSVSATSEPKATTTENTFSFGKPAVSINAAASAPNVGNGSNSGQPLFGGASTFGTKPELGNPATGENTCGNAFSFGKPEPSTKVSQSVPSFGGTSGFGSAQPTFGAPVASFGTNSSEINKPTNFGSVQGTAALGTASFSFGKSESSNNPPQPAPTFGGTSGFGSNVPTFGTSAAPAASTASGGNEFGVSFGNTANNTSSGFGNNPTPFGNSNTSGGNAGAWGSAATPGLNTSGFGGTATAPSIANVGFGNSQNNATPSTGSFNFGGAPNPTPTFGASANPSVSATPSSFNFNAGGSATSSFGGQSNEFKFGGGNQFGSTPTFNAAPPAGRTIAVPKSKRGGPRGKR